MAPCLMHTLICRFDCSNNRLSSLPSSLGHCTDLAELKVIFLCVLFLYMCARFSDVSSFAHWMVNVFLVCY